MSSSAVRLFPTQHTLVFGWGFGCSMPLAATFFCSLSCVTQLGKVRSKAVFKGGFMDKARKREKKRRVKGGRMKLAAGGREEGVNGLCRSPNLPAVGSGLGTWGLEAARAEEWGEAELCPGLHREGSNTRGWDDRSALLNLEEGNDKTIIIILLMSFKCRGCLKDKESGK